MSKKNAGIISWGGEGNLGDDLLALSAERIAIEKGFNVTHITNRPFGDKWVFDFDGTLKSFIKTPIRNSIFNQIKFYFQVDEIFMAIGGAVSNWNTIVAWRFIFRIYLFKFFGKKVHAIGVSCKLDNNKPLYTSLITALKKCDSISVRDSNSFKSLQANGIRNICATRDIAYSYNLPPKDDTTLPASPGGLVVGVNFVPLFYSKLWKNNTERLTLYKESIEEFIYRLSENPRVREIKILYFHHNFDRSFFEEFKFTTIKNLNIVEYLGNPESFITEMTNCDIVVASRFHCCVLCEKLKIPVIPVIYDNKVNEFSKENNLTKLAVNVGDGQNWIDEIFSPAELEEKLETLIDAAHTSKENINIK